jgi:hypothetical protein
MIMPKTLWILLVCCLAGVGAASQNDAAVPVRIRAVMHDPVHPIPELFVTDKAGAVVKLELVREGFSKAQFALPLNGSLVLYDKADIDPKKPEASLAASVKLPADLKRAMVVVMPAPAGSKPAYRMVFIDDSAEAFPKGESRVLPLLTVETAIQAGEHRLAIHPGKITNVPAVKKVNEYNLAQTNFYYKQGESWVPFTERQLQFIDAYRRLFIVHVTPGALQPEVTTIVDTTPPLRQ